MSLIGISVADGYHERRWSSPPVTGKVRAVRALWLITAAVICAPVDAEAATFSLRSRTVYHAYQIPLISIDGARNLNRFYEWVDARLWGFGPDGAMDATASVRFDTDFGTGYNRDTPIGLGIPATDERNDVEISYLFVDYKGLIANRLDLRLGRQLLIDDLDFYSLDGLKVTLRAFPGNFVELYAGRAVPYGAILSAEPFINDGVEVSDGVNLAFGGALNGRFGPDLSFSLAYRHELLFRKSDIEVFGRDPSTPDGALVRSASGGKIGLQEWLLGGSLSYVIRPAAVDVYAHGVWNLLFGTLDQARAGAGWNPSRELHVGAEYLRSRPRFAGDSIFNVFNIFPYDRVRAEVTYQLLDGLVLEGGYFFQHLNGGAKGPKSTEASADPNPVIRGGEGAQFGGSSRTHGPSVGVTYREDRWRVGAYGEADTNASGFLPYGGTYRRLEVFGDMSFFEKRLQGLLRLGFTGFQNDWWELRDQGDVPPEERSYSVDTGVRGVIIENLLSARVNFIKNFSSSLEGSYRIWSEVEVTY